MVCSAAGKRAASANAPAGQHNPSVQSAQLPSTRGRPAHSITLAPRMQGGSMLSVPKLGMGCLWCPRGGLMYGPAGPPRAARAPERHWAAGLCQRGALAKFGFLRAGWWVGCHCTANVGLLSKRMLKVSQVTRHCCLGQSDADLYHFLLCVFRGDPFLVPSFAEIVLNSP